MYSFYGGYKGNGLIISYCFPTLTALQEDFNRKNDSKVKYQECAIINFDASYENGIAVRSKNKLNKNKLHNGEIYRHDPSGPVLIGTLLGPTGQKNKFKIISSPLENSYSINSNSIERVSGKINQNKECILYQSYLIEQQTQNNQNNIFKVYIHFKIPYLVNDFQINYLPQDITQYINVDDITLTLRENNINLTNILKENKPFYKRWQMNLPFFPHGAETYQLKIITDPNNKIKKIYRQQKDYLNNPYTFKEDNNINLLSTINYSNNYVNNNDFIHNNAYLEFTHIGNGTMTIENNKRKFYYYIPFNKILNNNSISAISITQLKLETLIKKSNNNILKIKNWSLTKTSFFPLTSFSINNQLLQIIMQVNLDDFEFSQLPNENNTLLSFNYLITLKFNEGVNA